MDSPVLCLPGLQQQSLRLCLRHENNMERKNLFYQIAMFTIILGFFLVGLIAYWLFTPYEILTFGPDNAKLLNPVVKSGGYLRIQRDFCKKMDLVAQVDRTFIDSLKYDAPIDFSNESVGCHKDILYIYIPKALPPGAYYVQDLYTFTPNPIRKIYYTVIIQQFMIEER